MTFYCDVCGRELSKKIRIYGYTLCSKHMHQYLKHGKFLDNNPRTENDLNDFIIEGDIAIFDVYNIRSEKVDEFIVDREDVDMIRYHKWRKDNWGRIITGNCTNKNPRRELSRFLLEVTDEDLVVDHKDGNPLNNRRSNLRICTQANNMMNKARISNNTSGFIGVIWENRRNHWAPEIRCGYKRWHLGRYDKLEEAVYARYCAEVELFGEFRNTNRDDEKFELFDRIDDDRLEEIRDRVLNKIRNS